jgi:hypothetical protein
MTVGEKTMIEKFDIERYRVNDEICDFPVVIDSSKSSLQILWLLLEKSHLQTKRGNEGKPEPERTEKNERRLRLSFYLAG